MMPTMVFATVFTVKKRLMLMVLMMVMMVEAFEEFHQMLMSKLNLLVEIRGQFLVMLLNLQVELP